MKILLLGSGELGKEFVIAAQRIGQTIIAVDSYENAPAMQVAHGFEVINMLDGEALDRIVAKHQPDFIVPEVEAIATHTLKELEKEGFNIIPTANATWLTMNREGLIRVPLLAGRHRWHRRGLRPADGRRHQAAGS